MSNTRNSDKLKKWNTDSQATGGQVVVTNTPMKLFDRSPKSKSSTLINPYYLDSKKENKTHIMTEYGRTSDTATDPDHKPTSKGYQIF